MTTLEWPNELPPANRDKLCAELDSLIEQVINQDLHAMDTLDDQFARMGAALLALLKAHRPDQRGQCTLCPPGQQPPCTLLHTVHQYLKQPLTLMWWHLLRERGSSMGIDEIGAWLERSMTPRD